jgi:hypothetical protein
MVGLDIDAKLRELLSTLQVESVAGSQGPKQEILNNGSEIMNVPTSYPTQLNEKTGQTQTESDEFDLACNEVLTPDDDELDMSLAEIGQKLKATLDLYKKS